MQTTHAQQEFYLDKMTDEFKATLKIPDNTALPKISPWDVVSDESAPAGFDLSTIGEVVNLTLEQARALGFDIPEEEGEERAALVMMETDPTPKPPSAPEAEPAVVAAEAPGVLPDTAE